MEGKSSHDEAEVLLPPYTFVTCTMRARFRYACEWDLNFDVAMDNSNESLAVASIQLSDKPLDEGTKRQQEQDKEEMREIMREEQKRQEK